ncbi:MAG: sigma-54-dependent Fis family transcriptional regulator, partial [Bacteroidetes bacterium]
SFLKPDNNARNLPILSSTANTQGEFANEREILYKLFFDMKKDVMELKKMVLDMVQNPALASNLASMLAADAHQADFNSINEYQNFGNNNSFLPSTIGNAVSNNSTLQSSNNSVIVSGVTVNNDVHAHVEVEETLNIMDKEKELIVKALKKHKGKRKDASLDLGISERTLYRKLKEYDIEE